MSIPSWARVGAQCVCISDWGGHKNWYMPKRQTIYTVDEIDADHQSGPMLMLEEIISPNAGYKFPIRCFRPLVIRTQEQDVRAIRKLVDEMPITERAEAADGELL